MHTKLIEFPSSGTLRFSIMLLQTTARASTMARLSELLDLDALACYCCIPMTVATIKLTGINSESVTTVGSIDGSKQITTDLASHCPRSSIRLV